MDREAQEWLNHSYPHFIGQNSGTWTYVTSGEAGKCIPSVGPGGKENLMSPCALPNDSPCVISAL